MWWRVYRGNIQDPGGKIQGAPEGTLPIHVHNTQTGHNTTPDNFNIKGREDHGLARTIKEYIYIQVNNLTLNRNIGKYNLHHIWDRVLLNTPDVKINNANGHVHRTYITGHAQSIPTNRFFIEPWAYLACSEFRACA